MKVCFQNIPFAFWKLQKKRVKRSLFDMRVILAFSTAKRGSPQFHFS